MFQDDTLYKLIYLLTYLLTLSDSFNEEKKLIILEQL